VLVWSHGENFLRLTTGTGSISPSFFFLYDDGHVVVTTVAPREAATEIYFGENPGGNHA
jgi:hypothetical protein